MIKVIVYLLSVLLVACSSTQLAYYQNFVLFQDSETDLILSEEDVINSMSDLILVSVADKTVATMALAFIEDGTYQWVSADTAIIETQNGRITRFLAKDYSVEGPFFEEKDPFTNDKVAFNPSSYSVKAVSDSIPIVYGENLVLSLSDYTSETLEVFNHSIRVKCVHEKVSSNNILGKKEEWLNKFCYDAQSKELIGSSQRNSILMTPITLTYVSRIVRQKGLID